MDRLEGPLGVLVPVALQTGLIARGACWGGRGTERGVRGVGPKLEQFEVLVVWFASDVSLSQSASTSKLDDQKSIDLLQLRWCRNWSFNHQWSVQSSVRLEGHQWDDVGCGKQVLLCGNLKTNPNPNMILYIRGAHAINMVERTRRL